MRQLQFSILNITCLILCLGFLPSLQAAIPIHPSDSDTITVAVLDFKNNSGLFNLDGLEKSVPDMLKTELSRSGPRLVIVERQRMEAIFQEMAFAQSGVIDGKTGQEVGQLLGAEYLLSGEISTSGFELRIDCHILKVESGQVRGEKVTGRSREVAGEMVRLLASNIVFNLTGEGEYQQRHRLKNYPTSWFLVATVLSSAATGVTSWKSEQAYDDYQNTSKLQDFDSHYDRANNFRKARNGLAIASGTFAITTVMFWLKNRSEGNQIFAAAPEESDDARELILLTHEDGVQIGLRVKF